MKMKSNRSFKTGQNMGTQAHILPAHCSIEPRIALPGPYQVGSKVGYVVALCCIVTASLQAEIVVALEIKRQRIE